MNRPIENCPNCGTDLVGEEIPDNLKEHYAGTHWSKKIGIANHIGGDVVSWMCPVCKHQWKKGE
ncbi:hypothetical protein [Aneurinibacillus tyrosinisolvens]|uniref:hypothetical protein n=1 Tax=Aneurinibacillus tyrosinisolvens TaxID=1443435 RepID=UPI00063ED70D|nr:hypothetical protein [Aneurinibacillus tyrosinisolvens]